MIPLQVGNRLFFSRMNGTGYSGGTAGGTDGYTFVDQFDRVPPEPEKKPVKNKKPWHQFNKHRLDGRYKG